VTTTPDTVTRATRRSLTKAQRACLTHALDARKPVRWWPIDLCSMAVVRRCELRGWLERTAAPGTFAEWTITAAGSRALAGFFDLPEPPQ